MNILEVRQLSGGYGDIQILHDISLEVEKGSIAVLMGPNGAGKSTLLKVMFNIVDVSAGSVLFDGEDITQVPAHERLSKGLAFVMQGKVNFSNLSVRDNLLLGAHIEKDTLEVEKRLQKIYKEIPELKAVEKQLAFTLSGGQQQLLAMARALMSNPSVLLLDEPSLGLAPKLVKKLFEHIVHIRESFGTSIIIVEHNLQSLLGLADYVFVLVNGRVVAQGPAQEIQQSDIMKQVFVGALD